MQFLYKNQSWCGLLYAGSVFIITYTLTNHYAHFIDGIYGVKNISNTLDGQIPFIAPMIIAYALSLPLFIASFFLINTNNIQKLTHRLILITLTSGMIFYYFPLKFSFKITNFYFFNIDWYPLYHILFTIDKPYNQLPSLHVGYGVLIAISLHSTACTWYFIYRFLFIIVCILVIFSTIFTWQHHSYDIIAGFVCAFFIYFFDKNLNNYTPIIKSNIIKYITIGTLWFIIFSTLPNIIYNTRLQSQSEA